MDEIIDKIIEIEERANEIVSDAEKAKEGFLDQIEKESEKLRLDIEQRAKKKNEMLRNYEDGEAEKKIAEINSKNKEAMAMLGAKYEENKDKWIEDIVNNVIR